MIPFNKPYLTGKEMHYMYEAVYTGKISGNGIFTKKCQNFLKNRFGFGKCLLTTSCTDALEMAAILIDLKPGDEVIMPSFTFVSTANAFVLRGAKIIFADSRKDHPGMDEDSLSSLITDKTRAIVPVHYAGVACDMDKIMELAEKHNLYVIEDAAQAIDSYYTGKDGIKRPLGSIGHLAAFSFHETKNIISGEGGMLSINDPQFEDRAEIIWEKGTNRSAFFRGEVDKYGWVDMGSSFLPSDIIAAFLYAQLENLDDIQSKRKDIWNRYDNSFRNKIDLVGGVKLPFVPNFGTNNGHMYYLICSSESERNQLITHLKNNNILSVFHYLSLHKSEFYFKESKVKELKESDHFSDCLIRLPMFYELSDLDQVHIIQSVLDFYK
ncbi:dTDP-4-amino-4,6-dideoxygalactose transaminase [Cyclobacterium amurskyense]|uniref:TDP-4-oxo-6-deoxy-D-glucose aminotransferase n=1 Tax=Cyclobacterium amurskyense TaxID=320787 RepID=A0A0H4PDB1_9BACT|nr:dTDP-4-amino-4,6-dideoxygalactose transaminase [Cyclobacterium amurskyense]AKP52431.1 TDP-4-oxo-6-deoxy-D-glucose aminotransferase [Cyclobacterium amurskyense]